MTRDELIPAYLAIAGLSPDDPEWGAQYTQCGMALTPWGARIGIDPRVLDVLRSRGLGEMTPEGEADFLSRMRALVMRWMGD